MTSPYGALMHHRWFASIPEDLQQLLLSHLRVRHLKAGHRIHAKGEDGLGFYGICSGRVKICQYMESGKIMLLALLEAGNWFGEISMFDDLPRTHDAYAQSPTTLAVLPKAQFHQLLKTHPTLYPHFARLLCMRVRSAFQFIDSSATLSLRQQLIRRLVLLMTSYGQTPESQVNVELQVSQEVLAQMINASRQTTNQLLNELKAEGLIELGYGKLLIPTPSLLLKRVD